MCHKNAHFNIYLSIIGLKFLKTIIKKTILFSFWLLIQSKIVIQKVVVYVVS